MQKIQEVLGYFKQPSDFDMSAKVTFLTYSLHFFLFLIVRIKFYLPKWYNLTLKTFEGLPFFKNVSVVPSESRDFQDSYPARLWVPLWRYSAREM